MAPSNPPLFRLPSDPNPTTSVFSPPSGNVPSNGLFSAASTPVQPQRSSTTPATLFAGATPGFKSNGRSGLFGGGGDESPDATPKFSLGGATGRFGAKSGTGDSPLALPSSKFGARTGRESRRSGKYMSPDGDDDDEEEGHIFEDDTYHGEDTTHGEYDDDMEGETTGNYDDDDEEGEDSFDLLQSRHSASNGRPLLGADSIIKPGIVTEPGTLITRTEELMAELFRHMAPQPVVAYDSETEDDIDMDIDRPVPPAAAKKEEVLTRISKNFLETLASHLPKNDPKSRLHKAYYIVSLLLPLHYSRANVPETLRKWLHTHKQNPTRQQLHTLKGFHPNCVFSPSYWDILHSLIVRGEVQEVLDLMRNTDWDQLCVDAPASKPPKFGANANQAPGIEKRYTRAEIDSIKTATATCMRLLSGCPGLARSSYAPSSVGFFPPTATRHGSPADWRIWQGSVFAACEALRGGNTDAEDSMLDETDDSYYNNFHPRNGLGSFGLGGGGKAKEKAPLPHEVTRGLRQMYEVMRGDRDAVTTGTDRWEDAVVGLMFWNVSGSTGKGNYDDSIEEEESDYEGNGATDLKVVDRARREKELLRLRRTTESLVEGDMPLDPMSELELAIGGIMTWDVSVVGDILPKFSLLAASAVVEICGWAGEIKRNPIHERVAEPKRKKRGGMLDHFDDDDIAVLQMGKGVTAGGDMADGVLLEYAAGLFGVEWVDEKAEFEGWEAGVGVLERVRGGRELAGKLLTQLELDSKARVEKLLTYCNENNLVDEASDIAASFAGHLVTSATSYGDSLHFYALSTHHRPAIHNLLTKLLSASLLASASVPQTSDLDPMLTHLLSSPTAAESPILRFELSGYAALRNFYALRDSGSYVAALKALVATIKSAGEKLDGGVLDPEWECAVEEWTLGALLGELLPFLGRKERVVGVREAMDVMKVLTDFECVGGECARRADEFLGRVLEAKDARGNEKGMVESSMGGSMMSSWEDVRRSIQDGSLLPGKGDTERMWDWRDGLGKVGMKEIIAMVRLALSREVARAWLDGEE